MCWALRQALGRSRSIKGNEKTVMSKVDNKADIQKICFLPLPFQHTIIVYPNTVTSKVTTGNFIHRKKFGWERGGRHQWIKIFFQHFAS